MCRACITFFSLLFFCFTSLSTASHFNFIVSYSFTTNGRYVKRKNSLSVAAHVFVHVYIGLNGTI